MTIFSEAMGILSERWKAIVLACFLPLVTAALLEVMQADETSFVVFPLVLVQLYVYTCIAVAVHRIVLIGPDAVPVFGFMLNISRRELRFAGVLLLFAALVVVATLFTNGVVFVALIVLAAMFYFVPVFSIVFPAVAVDSDLTLRELLSYGHSHYWLLAKAALIVPLVIGFLVNALGKVVVNVFGDVSPVLAGIAV